MRRPACHLDVSQISIKRREPASHSRSAWVVQLLALHRSPWVDPTVPSFAREGVFELLPAPFGERLSVRHGAPGDAFLTTRLTCEGSARPVVLHWEVACDARFREVERYGLLFANGPDYLVSVPLCGLSPGRSYWARLWAGGSWSASVRIQTGSHETPRARPVLRALRTRSSTWLDV